MDEWLSAHAMDLGRAIGAGQIDPVDLCETYLAAIDAHPLGDRIYARVTHARARDEATAAAARAKAGLRRSALDGVPISWKDLFDTAGIATEAGSALLKDRVPGADAAVLQNATAAGLVCLGKTHLTELAFSGLGLNPVTASPPCVNDPDAVSGGSSSGAATSVAFGLAACGIGSDTGGSVRVPAAWNDLVGFKTSPGSLPMGGVVPLCPRFDTIGPLARSVEDAAHIWAAMAGQKAPDLTGATLDGARLMVLDGTPMADLAPQVRDGFEAALIRLAKAGAIIERHEIAAVERALPLSAQVFASEAYGVWGPTIAANPDVMFPPVRERFESGKAVSAPDYVAAWREIDCCRAEYREKTAGFDAVLLPTCPILPPTLARLEADQDYFVEKNLMTLRNTRVGNLMGLPGLTLPTGTPSVGVLMQMPAGSDRRLLRLGRVAETLLA